MNVERVKEQTDSCQLLVPPKSRLGWIPAQSSPRGRLALVACSSGAGLASQVADHYREHLGAGGDREPVLFLEEVDFRFSDSETCVRLEADVSGCDAFLFQALLDPTSGRSVDENYVALLAAARALREWGANHVTAILPYLAYARQDKPSASRREPTTAKLMADLSATAGIERIVTWHPHSARLQGFYGDTPVDALDPLAFYVQMFDRFGGQEDVVLVAPDGGASKFVMRLGRALDLSCAIASKHRPQPEQAVISEIIGDFSRKRVAVVVDDMISSGGTMYALITTLIEQTEVDAVYVAVSHNLGMTRARERLKELHAIYHLAHVVVTNSVPQQREFLTLPFVSSVDLANIFTYVVDHIHHNRPVSCTFSLASD